MRDPRGGDPFEREEQQRRRQRSHSPPNAHIERHEAARRGNYDRPSPKRSRRDDGNFDRFRDQSPHRGSRGSPPRGRYDDGPRGRQGHRREDRDPPRHHRNLTFKEFIMDQPGDLSPEEAQKMYRAYLSEVAGSQVKSEFLDKRDSDAMRVAFDPRSFEKALISRNEAAKASASKFREELESGALDPSQEGFNQGMYDKAPKPGKRKEEAAPAAPAEESHAVSASSGKEENDEDKEQREEGEGEGDELDEKKGEDLSADQKHQEPMVTDEPEAVFAPRVCWTTERVGKDLSLAIRLIRKVDAEKGIVTPPLLPLFSSLIKEGGGDEDKSLVVPTDDLTVEVTDSNLEECTSKLDLLLTYLFVVHGIDYYAGYEFTAHEFPMRLTGCRILRGAKPLGSEPLTEEEVKEQSLLVEETVDVSLQRRISEGDPLELRCQKRKVDELIDRWVEDQVVEITPEKWSNKLSNKMFMEKKFVLKHVRTKHEDKLLEEKERILDEMYFENFKAWKAEEAEANRAQRPNQRAEIGVLREGGRGGGGHGMRGGMRGGGRGGGRRRMGGPMFLPGPGMAPMMMIPAGSAPLMAPMILAQHGFESGGMGRGGMMMGGGRGGGRGAPGSYVDLDDPKNSRQVLDYGDL